MNEPDNNPLWAMDREGPCFSFVYAGQPSASLLKGWRMDEQSRTVEGGCVLRSRTYTSGDGGLVVTQELTEFSDSRAVEWVVRIRNAGGQESPILEDILPLDITLAGITTVPTAGTPSIVRYSQSIYQFVRMLFKTGIPPIVCYSKGTRTAMDDYALQSEPLHPGGSIKSVNSGGGKTTVTMPFFSIQTGGKGLFGAVGWPGKWQIALSRPTDTTIHIQAGMEKTRLALLPGEEIRTPSILLLPWEGDAITAHNQLRQHILKHHTPHYDGKPVHMPLCCGTWGGMKTANHLRAIELLRDQRLHYDVYWIDAGWYGTDHATEEFQDPKTEDWYFHVGDWNVNAVVHPQGLKPISDAAHAAGMKFLLWFEPQRAMEGTPVVQKHPEWFFAEFVEGWKLNRQFRWRCFDFGNAEARQWMTDWISGQITNLGIDIFRQDCNFAPAHFWQLADASNRQGIAEIHYVEGLLWFWDELRRRHPHLILDIAQYGDLETMTRGIDLYRSDYAGLPTADPIGNQVGTDGLSYWRPLLSTGFQTRPGDTYQFRSGLCAGMAFAPFATAGHGQGFIFLSPDYPFDWHRAMIEQHRRARPYYYGDYYPLLDGTLSPQHWFGYQMHRSDLREGMVMVLRRPESPFLAARFRLQGLNASAKYEVENVDNGSKAVLQGSVLLREGLETRLDEKPASCLIFYREV